MRRVNVLGKLKICLTSGIACILFVLFLSGEVWALGAYVYYKGKTNPDYITRFTIYYAKTNRSIGGIYATLPRLYKYLEYDFNKISKVEFLEVVGEEYSCPVFLICLRLWRRGAPREAWLFPVKEFRGWKRGAPWEFPMDSFRGNEENALKIKEIRFVDPRRK